MTRKTARLFTTGRSRAVRLPMAFRFEGKEVYFRRDPSTGDVILSRKPDSWGGLFALHGEAGAPNGLTGPSDRAR